MTTALCPGSFDPPTNGHIDVIQRALAAFDHVVVGVIANPSKHALFSSDERVEILEKIFDGSVEVAAFDGLLVDFARERNVDVIVKGLRAVTDFDYELQMAQMNHHLADIDTFFVAANPAYGYLSSSLVREVGKLGGDVSTLVPAIVLDALEEKYRDG